MDVETTTRKETLPLPTDFVVVPRQASYDYHTDAFPFAMFRGQLRARIECMAPLVIREAFARAGLVFPLGWSDFQVAFGALWSCINHPPLAEEVCSIIDVMSDNEVFVPYHYLDMAQVYAVVCDELEDRLAQLSRIPAGVGAGHREVVHDFNGDPYLLTRQPPLSIEEEVEPVESQYIAFGIGHYVKLQLNAAHVKIVADEAGVKKGAFILAEEFNKLCCRFKIQARPNPPNAEPFNIWVFSWLSAFSRRMSPVVGDTMGSKMGDLRDLLKRAAANAPSGSASGGRLSKAAAWFGANQYRYDKDASALRQCPLFRSIMVEDLEFLALGHEKDVSVAVYRFGRKDGENGPGKLVGGNTNLIGGMEMVVARMSVPHIIGMDDDGLAWVVRYAGNAEMLVMPVLAARAAMLIELGRIIEVDIASSDPSMGGLYYPWEAEESCNMIILHNAGRYATDNFVALQAQFLAGLATIGIVTTEQVVSAMFQHALRVSTSVDGKNFGLLMHHPSPAKYGLTKGSTISCQAHKTLTLLIPKAAKAPALVAPAAGPAAAVIAAQPGAVAAVVTGPKKYTPTEFRMNLQFLRQNQLLTVHGGIFLGVVRGVELREGSLNAVSGIMASYLNTSAIFGVELVAAVVRHEIPMGSYMFYGDEACLHMWVPAELALKVPDFQDQLGIQGGLRRVLVVRGFVFELSSQMDIRNRRRTHFEDVVPFCSHLRLSPRAADVTAQEAFDFLASLAEDAGAELYLFGPHKTTKGYDWVALTGSSLNIREMANPYESRFGLLQYASNPFQENSRIPSTANRSLEICEVLWLDHRFSPLSRVARV